MDRFIRRGDAKLAVRDYGGHGVSLLLLHGLTHNLSVWDKVGPQLARRHRVAAFDSRGHGRTEAATDYSLAAHIEDVRTITRELEMRPTVLVGHSQGAVPSVATAGRWPAEVLGVVNVDGLIADPAEFGREFGIDREDMRRELEARLDREWYFEGDITEVDRWLSEQRRGHQAWLEKLRAEGLEVLVEPFDVMEPVLRRQLREVAHGRYERVPNRAEWGRLMNDLLDPLHDGVAVLYERLERPSLIIRARGPLGLRDVSDEQAHALDERLLDRVREHHRTTQVERVASSHHNLPLVLAEWLTETISGFVRRIGRQ